VDVEHGADNPVPIRLHEAERCRAGPEASGPLLVENAVVIDEQNILGEMIDSGAAFVAVFLALAEIGVALNLIPLLSRA
jgi:hypothetical protein